MRIKKNLIKQKKQVNCKFTCFFWGWDVTGLGYNKTARRWPCGLLMVEISGIEPLTSIQALSQLSYTPMGKMYIIRHAAKCQEFFHAFRKSLKIILCGWV